MTATTTGTTQNCIGGKWVDAQPDRELLEVSNPATGAVLEDLLLLGALDDRFEVGSMNRGGLGGAVFELDDRFTAWEAAFSLPNVFGLVVGRSLLFPRDDDCERAVDRAVALLAGASDAGGLAVHANDN